mmetsp:Transcript_17/g.56  ORF Transcript_17/g.56 Transcript_17/m.56 type:complete len:207 (+) Transcript_17:166-786(+)
MRTNPPGGQALLSWGQGSSFLSRFCVQGWRFRKLLMVPQWLTTAIRSSGLPLSHAVKAPNLSPLLQCSCQAPPGPHAQASFHASRHSAVASSDKASATMGHGASACSRGHCWSLERGRPLASWKSAKNSRSSGRITRRARPDEISSANMIAAVCMDRVSGEHTTSSGRIFQAEISAAASRACASPFEVSGESVWVQSFLYLRKCSP